MDIDKYLPIKSSADAILFCDDHDGLLEQRKKATLRRVYGASDVTSSTAFVASVSDIFFHENYQISHRWPTKQYVINFYVLLIKIFPYHNVKHFFLRSNKATKASKVYKNSLPDVPQCFVNLVHVTLYKLVGAQLIPKEVLFPDFFAKIRVRFQNASKKVNYLMNTSIKLGIAL